jgi:hypothetical protein
MQMNGRLDEGGVASARGDTDIGSRTPVDTGSAAALQPDPSVLDGVAYRRRMDTICRREIPGGRRGFVRGHLGSEVTTSAEAASQCEQGVDT